MRTYPVDNLAARLAASQCGLVSHRQLVGARCLRALDRDEITQVVFRRVAIGRWQRVEPEVYALPGHTRNGLWPVWRALLAAGPGVLVAADTAAAIQQFPGYKLGGPVVLLTDHANRPHVAQGARLIRTRRMPGSVRVAGLPLTPQARTVADLAAGGATVDHLLTLIVAWVGRSGLRARQLERTYFELASPGRRGIRRYGEALATALSQSDVPTASELEVRLRALFDAVVGVGQCDWEADLPGRPADSALRVDCLCVLYLLIGEADGRDFHARMLDFEVDRARDRMALAAGYATARYAWPDMTVALRESLVELRRIVAQRAVLLGLAA